MTIDPETVMAYADGELDDVAARRIERAMAHDPALAEAVAAHRRLAARLVAGFAPVAEDPVPDRLAALLAPVALPVRRRWWQPAAAVAASLVIGVMAGQTIRPDMPVTSGARGLVASGALARALDTQLASGGAVPVRMIATFRDRSGALCRIFADETTSGIACRSHEGWLLRRTASGPPVQATDYRQAASTDAAIMAAAQDMMAGAPLDATAEKAARDRGWR